MKQANLNSAGFKPIRTAHTHGDGCASLFFGFTASPWHGKRRYGPDHTLIKA